MIIVPNVADILFLMKFIRGKVSVSFVLLSGGQIYREQSMSICIGIEENKVISTSIFSPNS